MKYKFFSLFILLVFIGCRGCNDRPMVIELICEPAYYKIGEAPVKISCRSYDPDKDKLVYTWNWSGGIGEVEQNGSVLFWKAENEGIYNITVEINDGKLSTSDFTYIEVVKEGTGSYVLKGGEIKNGILTKENSPYLVMGDLIVPENKTLEIEPGVEIYFKIKEDNTESGEYSDLSEIRVYGTLIAKGYGEEFIVFSAFPKQSNEKNELTKISHQGEDWAGIKFYPSSKDSILEKCVIEYGSWNIVCEKSSPVIKNSIIRLCGRYDIKGGIYLEHSSAIIEGNYITGTGGGTTKSMDFNGGDGIKCVSSQPEIKGNIIGKEEKNKIFKKFPAKYFLDKKGPSEFTTGNSIKCENNSIPKIYYNTIINSLYTGILSLDSSPEIFLNHIEGSYYAIKCQNSPAKIYQNNLIASTFLAIVASVDQSWYKLPYVSDCYITGTNKEPSPWLNVNPQNSKNELILNIGAYFYEKEY